MDLEICEFGRKRRLAGRRGELGEAALVADLSPDDVPVFLGAGLGGGLRAWLTRQDRAPGARAVVVDAEADIAKLSGTVELAAESGKIIWIDDDEPEAVLRRLRELQDELGPLTAVLHPFYARLAPELYAALATSVASLGRQSLWQQLRKPRFQGQKPRILLYAPRYHLVAELARAAQSLGLEVFALDMSGWETGRVHPAKALLEAVAEFQPDFAVTVNHLGLDREGAMVRLHEKLRLPLASWLVDHPETILVSLPELASPWVSVFCWDRATLPLIDDLGHGPACHLPLAADLAVFGTARTTPDASYNDRVVFVGRTLADKLAWLYGEARFPAFFLRRIKELSEALSQSGEVSVLRFLRRHHPELWERLTGQSVPEMQNWAQMALFWQVTKTKRSRALMELGPFHPLIVGDAWMTRRLRRAGFASSSLPAQTYEDVLPGLYAGAAVNFNTTTGQTRSGLNQRFYDVPASGGFLLTDAPAELEDSFEPGREVATYSGVEGIAWMVEKALADPGWRASLAQAGRQRVLASHTYRHRLEALCRVMRQRYASP